MRTHTRRVDEGRVRERARSAGEEGSHGQVAELGVLSSEGELIPLPSLPSRSSLAMGSVSPLPPSHLDPPKPSALLPSLLLELPPQSSSVIFGAEVLLTSFSRAPRPLFDLSPPTFYTPLHSPCTRLTGDALVVPGSHDPAMLRGET
jgi:hypothetical protein